MKTILCYGDSNTHGSNPDGGDRFGLDTRWGSVLRKQLGDGYWVIEEGLGGRTAIWDDPVEPDYSNDIPALFKADGSPTSLLYDLLR